MAFEKNFTDQYGENYPASYWRVVECNLQKEAQSGQIVFNGYSDKNNAGKRIIGQKAYAVTADLYTQYFLPALIQPVGVDHIKQCYALSMAVLNIDTDTKDAQDKEIMVSFFNGATDI